VYLAKCGIGEQLRLCLRGTKTTHRAGRGAVEIRGGGAGIRGVRRGDIGDSPGEVVFKIHRRKGYGDGAGQRGVSVGGQRIGSTVCK